MGCNQEHPNVQWQTEHHVRLTNVGKARLRALTVKGKAGASKSLPHLECLFGSLDGGVGRGRMTGVAGGGREMDGEGSQREWSLQKSERSGEGKM